MSDPRRHHLLPRFYLRSFADRDERITVIPRQAEQGPTKPHTTGIVNVLVERDFYTITDEHGGPDFALEHAFSVLESRAAEALRVLLEEGLVLSDRLRSAWSEFMAFQVTRGRQFRKSFADFVDRSNKGILRTLAAQAPDEYFERISAELVAQGKEPLGEITPEVRKKWADGERFTVVPSQEHTIEMSMVAIDELTIIFFQMAWKLVRFAAPCLFTSDHPVLYWREPDRLSPFMGIGPATANEIRIPLSPSAVLVLTHPYEIDEDGDAEHQGDQAIARCLNRNVLAWPANKQWLICPDVERHPLPVTRTQWRTEWQRPWLPNERYS